MDFLSTEVGGDEGAYSPTSPAGSHSGGEDSPLAAPTDFATATAVSVGRPGSFGTSGFGEALDELKEVKQDYAARHSNHRESTEVVEEEPETKKVAANPVLYVGTRLDKVCPLRPNRWIKIGRSAKANIRIENAGVSRQHCSLRWDAHMRIVELRDTSASGTAINGAVYKGQRRTLAHGDKVHIDGKGIRYEFVLDMRPVGVGLTDPREGRMPTRSKAEGLRRQLEKVKKDIQRFLETGKAAQERALVQEKTYYETMARRKLRGAEIEKKEVEYRKYVDQIDKTEKELKQSREQWLEKLQEVQRSNDLADEPLTKGTALEQKKYDLMLSLKVAKEHEANPAAQQLLLQDIRGEVRLGDIAQPGGLTDFKTPGTPRASVPFLGANADESLEAPADHGPELTETETGFLVAPSEVGSLNADMGSLHGEMGSTNAEEDARSVITQGSSFLAAQLSSAADAPSECGSTQAARSLIGSPEVASVGACPRSSVGSSGVASPACPSLSMASPADSSYVPLGRSSPSTVVSPEATMGDEDLFGDYDSDEEEEPPAKRPRQDDAG